MKKIVFIEGMSCEHCVKHATEALKDVTGVKKAKVTLKNNSAVVTGDFSEEAVKEAISEAGYTVTAIQEA